MSEATVYDPHPGEGGCMEPLPESLRCAAAAMAGQRLPLTEVVDRLQSAASTGALCIEKDYIGYGNGRQLYVPCASPGLIVWENNWRVVRIER
jgi:hypothetical protein